MKVYNLLYRREGDLKKLIDRKGIEDSDRVLVQVFTGLNDDLHIRRVQKELKACFPTAPVIGTTTGGEVFNGGIVDHSTVISVAVFERSRVRVSFSDEKDSLKLGRQLAEGLKDRDQKVMIAFADGLGSNGDRILRGLHEVSPEVPVAGGLAGDMFTFTGTYTFTQDFLSKTGGVCACIYTDRIHINTLYNLAWIPIGKEMTITKAEGNRIYEIEGRPAVEIYKEYLGKDAETLLPHIAIEFPLVFERDGKLVARACLGIDDDGAMVYEGDINEGERVRFSIWDTGEMLDGAGTALKVIRGVPVEGIFVYTCAARKYLMGKEVEVETKYLQSVAPTVGFLTYGEFFTDRGTKSFFNYTITLITLSENDRTKKVADASIERSSDRETVRFRALVSLVNSITRELKEANRELETLATTDGLTGLYNRRKMIQVLETEVYKARRYGTPLSVIMLDVDNFKAVNDTFGHCVGDELLVAVANILKENLRKSDVVGRWGGEEFLILMPGIDLTEGVRVAEKLKREISRREIKGIRITASFGVAQLSDEDTVDRIISKADSAMYMAKDRGKNRVIAFQSSTA